VCKNEQIVAIVERKTWNDLAASIKDGRKENINKLLSLRESTNCKIIYLIEGKARYKEDTKFARISFKNLEAHLDHLIFRDNIAIIYSDSVSDSASRLVTLAKNYSTLKFDTEIPKIGGEEKLYEKI
jgi:ERCC4-type nuclease